MHVAQPEGSPCVIYLVRAANGPGPLHAFSEAMRRHPPGVDCELVLAMKGYGSLREASAATAELAFLEPRLILLEDRGFDLGAYFAAAAALRRSRYCFLNSFSVPLVEGWLAKLDWALGLPSAGLVGATGSWESSWSWIAYSLGLPSAYSERLPPARVVRRRLLDLIPEQAARGRRTAREALGARASTIRLLVEQERFPAHHLRTNAFMISDGTLQRLRLRSIGGKLDTLKLESGRYSLTRQVQGLGLRTLVVDCSGETFDHELWDRSRTFCQGTQEGLLVADNRTRLYERGDSALREVLAKLSWGAEARPA